MKSIKTEKSKRTKSMRNGQKDNGTLSGDYLGTRSFKGYRHKTESKPLMKRTTTSQDTQMSSSCKCCIKGCKKIGIYPLTIGIYLCEEHWRKMVNRTIKSIKL